MGAKESTFYLGKRGKVFGPFSSEQLESMKLSGEIESYTFLWDSKSQEWRPIESPPPAPGAAPQAHGPSWSRIEAICHNFNDIIAGLLENITDSGCDLVSRDPSDAPKLALKSSLVLNVVDTTKDKALNVTASLADVSRKEDTWVYHLRWAHRPVFTILFMLLVLMKPSPALAEKPQTPAAAAPGTANESTAEEADVEKIKEKYWAKGNETEMGVVQNRLYPKRHRIELAAVGGSLSGDPFLTSYTLGGTLGFHFSEFFAIHATAWQAYVGPSSALTTLQNDLGVTTNTNQPQNFIGGEARASVLYGKLSLLGAAILYFDAYFSAGAGRIATESGSNVLFSLGLGQQIHISRVIALNIDYRFVYYNETILGKTPGNLNQNLGSRGNLSSLLSLGVSFFFNFFGDG